MRSTVTKALGLGLLLALPAAALAADEAEAPPVRKVVLYKHGVGYFERHGTVRGDADVTLQFRADQMPDLLTSFFALDPAGRVDSIGYDSKDPIDKQLQDILIDVPAGSALVELVKHLKGARVEARVGADALRGRIMGVEPIKERVGDAVVTRHRIVVLTPEGIRHADLQQVSALRLLDEALQRDLERMLEITLRSKYTDRKDVRIAFRGEGERPVAVGYLLETPIWKTSYRLLYDGDEAVMQGWAIVDNPTTEDWEDVELTLVAGAPLSFVIDLYTPFYPERPEVSIASLVSAPQAGPTRRAVAEVREALELEGRRTAAMRRGRMPSEPSPQAMRPQAELLGAPPPEVQAGEIGELFAYTPDGPVTVGGGQAALIPILSDAVDGERGLYWARGDERVYNAFYLDNATALTLESGPVTFFEDGASLGQAMLPRALRPGMRQMLSYAVEPGVRVEHAVERRHRRAHEATLADGVLRVTRFRLSESRYRIHNETGRDQVLFLDHRKSSGHELLEPEAPFEELPQVYRFRVEAGEGVTAFAARERTEVSTTVRVIDAPVDRIEVWLDHPGVTPETRAFLEEVIEARAEIARLERARQERASRARTLAQDEERYSQMLGRLGDSARENELRARYATRLGEVEEEMRRLRAESQRLEQAIAERRDALAAKVRAFGQDG